MTHTPTPWYAYETISDNYSILSCQLKKNGLKTDIAHYVLKEDAEFIVRAVNAHDELVEACKGAIEQMEGFLSDGVSLGMAVKIQQIKQALAKAEEK